MITTTTPQYREYFGKTRDGCETIINIISRINQIKRGRRGRDRMVVGF
jgi:hypothetical protein